VVVALCLLLTVLSPPGLVPPEAHAQALPSLSINDVSLDEGNSGNTQFRFTVTLSAASSRAVHVDYATANGTATAGSDYNAASGKLTFPTGQTSQTFVVNVRGDTTPEPNETFFVNLTNPDNATIAKAQGTATIQNDDASPPPPTQPALSINNVSKKEGDSGTTDFTFTVSLSSPAGTGGVSFDIATADGTATTADNDYVAKSLTGQTIAQGGQSYSFTVQVNGDTTAEPDETFAVNVTAVTGATVADGQGTGTIQNDDQGGGGGGTTPSLSINDVTKAEGNSGTTDFVFTVTLSVATNKPVSVNYATANGTTNPATAGSDYVAANGTLTIKGGDTTGQITIKVNGDTDASEPNETFFVNLSNPVNATISDGQGLGTIQNDDNQSPTATPQSGLTTAEDTALLITLAGTDPENDPLTFKIASLPTNGKLYKGNSTAAADEITSASLPAALTGTEVTYLPNNNYDGPDSFTFVANDGTQDSAAATVSITVNGVNDAPVLANVEGTALSYTVGAPATSISATITVTDGDSLNLAGATVRITGNCVSADDLLSFANAGNITGAYTAGSCLMTLSGSDTVTNYQAALRNVKYSNANSSTSIGARTVTFQVNDGGSANNLSNTQTRDITIEVNDAPVLAAIETTALAYTENDAATSVSTSITVTDADSPNLTGATVQITTNCMDPQDVLSFTNTATITGVYTAASCLMTLTGSDTVANYQAALRNVKYSNSSNTPRTLTRTVTFQVDDGAVINHASNTVTRDITVTPVNDAPVGVTNESHDVTGNIRIQVPATSGLLVGVSDPENDSFTAQVDASSTHVGDITFNTDGSYTYNPKPGHEGTDTVKFKVCDNGTPSACSAVFDLTLTVSGMIWFIDDSATCSTCDGRLTAPFKTLGAFAAINDGTGDHPAGGDNIFVSSGTYTGGVTLLNNQKLIGEGATASLSTITGLTPPTDSDTLPSTNGSAPSLGGGVLLSDGAGGVSYTVRGLALGTASGAALGMASGADSFGTLNVSETSINTTGQALNLAGGTVSGTLSSVTSSGGTNNVSLSSVATSGTFDLGSGALSGATDDAFVVSGGNGTVTYSGTISNSAAARVISISNTATGGAISFTTTSAGGISSSSSGTGILIDGAAGNVTVGGAGGASGVISLTGAKGIEILGDAANNATGTFTFNHASIDTTSVATNHAVIVDGDQGTGTNDDVNATIDFNDVDITNPGGQVALIRGLAGGSVDFDSASSITRNDGGLGILVDSNAGGTINFNQTTKTLTTNTNAAVTLTNNTGATINFTGGNLDIDTTTATGFNATGGGSVTVQGTGNTISSSSATALNVANTTIGAAHLTFQSISSGSGSNSTATGIILDTTGSSGGLHVTGTGAANTGGTIQNKTGSDGSTTTGVGIYLNSTSGVQLAWMNLHDFQNFGIRGIGVNGFTLANSTITAGAGAFNGDNPAFDEGSVAFDNLTGTVSVTSSTISRAREANFKVINTSGNLNITVTGSTFSNTHTTDGLQGLLLEAGLNAGQNPDIVANITNSTFTANRARGIQAITNGAGTMEINIGNTNANSGGTFDLTQPDGIAIDLAHNSTGHLFFNVKHATITNIIPGSGQGALPINIFQGVGASSGSTLMGRVIGNTITGNNDPGHDGIFIGGGGSSTVTLLIKDNTISQIGEIGIWVQGVQGNVTTTINATIQHNTVTTNSGSANGIEVQAATSSCCNMGGAGHINATIGGSTSAEWNTVNAGSDSSIKDYNVNAIKSGSDVTLPGYAGGTDDLAAVRSFIAARNNESDTNEVSASTGIGGVGNFLGSASATPLPTNNDP
jgi:hypothetical protein